MNRDVSEANGRSVREGGSEAPRSTMNRDVSEANRMPGAEREARSLAGAAGPRSNGRYVREGGSEAPRSR
jgi:hypothetical protein